MALISLEGNIACGKSTVLHHLSQESAWVVEPEQVEVWRPWLKAFYGQMQAPGTRIWRTLGLQVRILSSFRDVYCRYLKCGTGTLVERSPTSARHIFVENAKQKGHMDDLEVDLYDTLHAQLGWTPRHHIYLRTTPEVVLARCNQRSRPEEKAVSLQYLQELHDLHEARYNAGGHPSPDTWCMRGNIIVVNADLPAEQVLGHVRRILSIITLREGTQ